jgi:SAM-dependent methyltransferase
MDAERPDLPPESFDALVTRNLTWALPHLPDVYRAWRRLLKKGGVLINFDADYCREDESKPLPKHHAHSALSHEEVDAYEHMKDELRPSQRPRPDWDRELLTQAGFRHIQVDTQVYRRIYREFDEFYNPTPIFALAAYA